MYVKTFPQPSKRHYNQICELSIKWEMTQCILTRLSRLQRNLKLAKYLWSRLRKYVPKVGLANLDFPSRNCPNVLGLPAPARKNSESIQSQFEKITAFTLRLADPPIEWKFELYVKGYRVLLGILSMIRRGREPKRFQFPHIWFHLDQFQRKFRCGINLIQSGQSQSCGN